MELAEVYRVIYDGPDDHLQGIIVIADDETPGQQLFTEKGLSLDTDDVCPFKDGALDKYLCSDYYTNQDKRLSMPTIKSGDIIMLNGPNKAAISAAPCFLMDFYLFGVLYKSIILDHPMDPDSFSAPLREIIVSRNGNRYLTILYAIFKKAAEAQVNIKLCNFNSNPDINLFGVIAARTSAIKHPAYSSLLYFNDDAHPGDKIKVRPGHDIVIPLSRTFVAVPLESELILDIVLFGDDMEMILVDTVTFPAKEGQAISQSEPIKCSKGEIIVEISWRYKKIIRT